jgi:hypothetical protein
MAAISISMVLKAAFWKFTDLILLQPPICGSASCVGISAPIQRLSPILQASSNFHYNVLKLSVHELLTEIPSSFREIMYSTPGWRRG